MEGTTANGKAWTLFIASALLSLLAALLNSFPLTLFGNLLFVLALVYVSIHFARQRRLAYFSVALGLLGLLFFFGSHQFVGAGLIVWGVVAALADAVQNRRWRTLALAGGLVAVCALAALLAVGGALNAVRMAGQRRPDTAPAQAVPSGADPKEAQASVMPIPTATDQLAPVEMVVIPDPVSEAKAAAMRAEALELAKRDRERQNASTRAYAADVLVDRETMLFHIPTCSVAKNRHMPYLARPIAVLQGYRHDRCVPWPGSGNGTTGKP